MLDRFIFENHLGQRFDGLANGVYLNYNDLRDYSWKYSSINDKISRFYRPITTRKIPLVVACDSAAGATNVKNRIVDLAESDIVSRMPGKIYIGDYYTNGYITGSTKSDYLINKRVCKINLTLTSDDPAWYRDRKYIFTAGESGDIGNSSGVDYAYDYPHDYSTSTVGRYITSAEVGDSSFRLTIYGEVTNPSIMIGGNTYIVYCEVGVGEVLTIDSISKTIMLTTREGYKINYFDKRNRENYIFEPIPAGRSLVSYSGAFSFDLTVIEKRSEPKWT